jgi:hypothetical protein
MILLIPGRHHALTQFQGRYLFRFINGGLDGERDTEGQPLCGPVDTVVFAVTSADHASTRRNPLPFFIRAMALHEFGTELDLPLHVYGIPEAGQRPDFAAYTVKTILHESEGRLDLQPANTVVVCATAVAGLYRDLGFRVWGGESSASGESLPWDLVERIASLEDWQRDPFILEHLHPASYRLFQRYQLGERLARLFSDPLISDDGDLTQTRDYGSYVRQMDENMAQKWDETGRYVLPGRIGDIGCAVGSWLKQASLDLRLANSDFYGIEITRPLYDICLQRRQNGEFPTPNIWFAQKNAVRGLVFRAGTMNTVHSSSLTHEIESYGSRQQLREFIANRRRELASGGVWINRDVIGPEDGDRPVLLELCRTDGQAHGADGTGDGRPAGRQELRDWLDSLSTARRFAVFARDFRAREGYRLAWSAVGESAETLTVRLSLRDAAEYLLTKDYTDNWDSEMHETFCHWAWSDWQRELADAGFTLLPTSRQFTNPWILEHRWLGKVALKDQDGRPLPWPPTTAIMVAGLG